MPLQISPGLAAIHEQATQLAQERGAVFIGTCSKFGALEAVRFASPDHEHFITVEQPVLGEYDEAHTRLQLKRAQFGWSYGVETP